MALDAALAGQLKSLLDNLKEPVELIAAYDERPKSAELRELLTEIATRSRSSGPRADERGHSTTRVRP